MILLIKEKIQFEIFSMSLNDQPLLTFSDLMALNSITDNDEFISVNKSKEYDLNAYGISYIRNRVYVNAKPMNTKDILAFGDFIRIFILYIGEAKNSIYENGIMN